MNRLLLILRSAESSRFGIPLFFLATFIVSVLELISVGGIPALLTVILTPDVMANYLAKYLPWFSVTSYDHLDMVLAVGIALILFLLLKSVISLAIALFQANMMVQYQARLSSTLLARYMDWSYERLLAKNSSELVRNAVSVPVAIVTSILISANILVTEVLLVILMGGVLFILHPAITALTFLILGSAMGAFFALLKNKLEILGRVTNVAAAKSMLWLNQSLGGVKEIRVLHCEQYFHQHYLRYFVEYSRATFRSQYIAQIPRYLLEIVVVAGMVGLAVALLASSNSKEILPSIALFGTVAIRLVPSANRIMSTLAIIRANINSVEIFENDTAEELSGEGISASLPSVRGKLENMIEVRGLSYSYMGSVQPALSSIDLSIRANSTVGIAGRSGAGKSTLLDILLGLHRASAGVVLVDDRDIWDNLPVWRALIGYVPQQPFILDDSIRRNIALGDDDRDIDDARVMVALEKANLGDFVNSLPQRLDTALSEGGARFSGGQRQRIGIARALYRNPEILFLDEPTSALDRETEQAIIETLKQLHGTITIIVIAHHAEIMGVCDSIFMLDQGRAIAKGTAAELEKMGISFK